MKYIKLILAAVFGFGAIVQVNDPDPLVWILMYGVASAMCVYSMIRPAVYGPPVVVGLIALVWAITLAPGVVGDIPFGDMFSAWEMKDTGIEQSREMYGLLLIAASMLGIAYANKRTRRGTATS
jgi:hypothetical protein